MTKMLIWKNYFTNLFQHSPKKLMQECSLPYIPNRLHSVGKINVDDFNIGEELYYRCNPSDHKAPYNNISLYDISHNRNFSVPNDYPKEDVLFDINHESDVEIISGKSINTSIIKSLGIGNSICKPIEYDQITAEIKLVHKPLPCMYPHSVFQVLVNNIEVNSENYKVILDKKNLVYKNLRRDIRLELTTIIYTSTIDNDSETEFITEL